MYISSGRWKPIKIKSTFQGTVLIINEYVMLIKYFVASVCVCACVRALILDDLIILVKIWLLACSVYLYIQ